MEYFDDQPSPELDSTCSSPSSSRDASPIVGPHQTEFDITVLCLNKGSTSSSRRQLKHKQKERQRQHQQQRPIRSFDCFDEQVVVNDSKEEQTILRDQVHPRSEEEYLSMLIPQMDKVPKSYKKKQHHEQASSSGYKTKTNTKSNATTSTTTVTNNGKDKSETVRNVIGGGSPCSLFPPGLVYDDIPLVPSYSKPDKK
jgi:hypothetical protein